MTALLVVGVVVLAALVIFQGLVLLEVVRQLSQIRRELDFDDRPVPVSVGTLAGKPLPEPARAIWSGNGTSGDGVLVLLSTDCATCRLVAAGLPDLLTEFERQKVVVVLQARHHDEVTEMLSEAGLARDSVVVDLEGESGPRSGSRCAPPPSSFATESSARGRSSAIRASSTSSSKHWGRRRERRCPATPPFLLRPSGGIRCRSTSGSKNSAKSTTR